MAVGKQNKKLSKRGKGKKKVADPFLKKDWYTTKAPSMFVKKAIGQTLCTRTQGTKIASDSLKGRIFEVSLADLQDNEADAYRKIKLRCEDVQGTNLLLNFHGMDFTRDKACSLIKKNQSLIEGRVDVKTPDGYTLRMFCIAFTQKRQNQNKKTWYANGQQKKQIRKKMCDIMSAEATKSELKDLVQKFIPEMIGKEIESACAGIYPIQTCFVRKVKVLKTPKFDVVKLMELHGDTGEDVGAKVDRANPAVEESTLTGSGGRL